MVNANVKGAKAERDVVDYLRATGYVAERVRLAGTYDRGDILVVSPDGSVVPHRIEVKNHSNLLSGLSQAVLDLDLLLAQKDISEVCAAIVKRPGKSVRDWYYVRKVSHVFGLPPA
jgi:Holliday junction resolvase